ncbi:MAG: bifunctional serine/threonine-protein kinase/formylglycine-generating enzyme family protein [Polyangiaceae bacterium]
MTTTPNDPLELIGTTIAEKYAVESLVGEGGFAVVYRARHLIWNRPVALKVFKRLTEFSTVDREKLLQEFIQEGALLAELSERSASIVQARDIGTLTLKSGEWIPYMVLEWLEGVSLETLMEEERRAGLPLRTVEEAVRLVEPVGQALAVAHKRGVVHRDVKPANIFILGDPRSGACTVKLLDFGIAKVVAHAQKDTGAFGKTAGQVTSFTPAYGAPEQFSRTHGATGPWTDVFALALILVELVTGKSALDGEDYLQLAVSAAHPDRRPTPRGLGAVVSDEVEAVFRKALAVAVEDRYQSVGESWADLRAALRPGSVADRASRSSVSSEFSLAKTSLADGLVPAAMSSGALPPAALSGPLPASSVTNFGDPPPAPSGSKLPLALVGAGAGLALVGGLAWFMMRGDGPHGNGITPQLSAKPAVTAAAEPASPCPPDMVAVQRKEGIRYFMGSSEETDPDDWRPAHQVTLSPYCIDRTEVTVEAYHACQLAGDCDHAPDKNEWAGITNEDRQIYDPLCNMRQLEAKAKHPVNCVDWTHAKVFCEKAGKRLPTEAEWEYAALGTAGTKYPWGNDAPSKDLVNGCGRECRASTGSVRTDAPNAASRRRRRLARRRPSARSRRDASSVGAQDIAGNVWEWVGDWYAPYAAWKLDDPPVADPTGPEKGDYRVSRGGAWNANNAAWLRPSFRNKDNPTKRSYGIGFRCAAPFGAGAGKSKNGGPGPR